MEFFYYGTEINTKWVEARLVKAMKMWPNDLNQITVVKAYKQNELPNYVSAIQFNLFAK